mgnify:CR=1 FL=1
MPHPSPATTRHRRPSWRLLLLTAVVLLAHWAVLRAAPLALAAHASTDAGNSWAFSTRTIVETPPPAVAADIVRGERIAPVVKPRRAAPTQADTIAQSQGLEQNSPPAPEQQAQAAIETIAPTVDATPVAAPDADLLVAVATSPPAPILPATPGTGDAVAASPAKQEPATLPAAKAVRKFAFPPTTRLKYDVKGEIKGFPYHVNGDLQWSQDGKTYNARMEISHFLLGSRVQTSTGHLGAHGLEPTRFGDKVRSEVAAHFDYDKNKVTFSANTPDVPMLPGAQDQLSVMLQIAAMLAAEPKLFTPASTLSFQAIGPRSAEAWVFNIGQTEKLVLPGGELSALRLWRDPVGEHDPRAEIWFAPDLGYLPVRIRLSQANGDVVDQQWKSTQK